MSILGPNKTDVFKHPKIAKKVFKHPKIAKDMQSILNKYDLEGALECSCLPRGSRVTS